jgi:hypothetical protein
VLADQVGRGIVPIADTQDVATAVAGFLSTHQADFAIGVEPVERYIAVNKISGTSAAVVTQIKRLQRVYQLTQDDASLSVLLRHNLDSAYAITRYDSAGFVRAFQAQLGGADKAVAVHARAKQVFGAVLNIATSYANARIAPAIGSYRVPIHWPFPPPQPSQNNPVIAYPTLEDLFGSLDYCNCSDCNSILSPAAYLVDLLNYLDQPAPTTGSRNPQDVLFERRPDLQYLPLTCENTNTALPYIDIVNETLEYYVANSLSLANYQGHDTGSDVTSAELLASPQYVNDLAYATLQGAFFPPPLPFNRPLELLRLHMQNLGVALSDAMIALRASDELVDPSTPTSYGWSDILIEQLGISRDEYRLVMDTTLQLGDLYGIPKPAALTTAQWNAQVLSTLQAMSLQDFSRRVGVSYVDLSTILLTQFINPYAVLIPRLQKLNAPFSILQTSHDNMGTAQSIEAQFIAALPAGLDATQYGGSTPTGYQAVVNWVIDPKIYPRIMGLITLTNTSGGTSDCSGAAWQLRYSNPDNTKNALSATDKNALSATDFLKLIRFIRLWQKLTPLLGDADDSVTIAQTDALLAALYPPADLPVDSGNAANDPTNRPLLDAGFQTLLLRTGFLFQVMNRLSLTADAALVQLLACWAPLGTVGKNAIYQGMFLTPTLLQQDPGAQTATVSDIVNIGDILTTSINGPNGASILPHTVAAGETAATVAAAIAATINATTAVDPASQLPLNKRFFASSNGGVITIKAGFTLACSVSAGAGETYTAAATSPLLQTATVAGTIAAGDVLTTTIDGVAIPYTVAAGDTPATIAANIRDAINNATLPDPFSGLPLNSLVAASSSGAVVTLVAANAGAPFTLACSLQPGKTGSYTTAAQLPSSYQGTIGGTIGTSDTLTTTFTFLNSANSVVVTYNAQAADTTADLLAASVAAAINGAVQQDPTTSLPLNSLVHATTSGSAVVITAVDPSMPFTVACSATGGATYSAAGPSLPTQRAGVADAIPAGTTLTTTINGLDLFYIVATGDGPSSIAANIATLINSTTTPDPVTNLPLNAVVSASHVVELFGATATGVVVVTASSPTTVFTLAVSVSASGYTAGRKTPPFADDGYGDFLADSTQTLFGHEPSICAACNLTGAEFSLIATALGFDATTPLTLANVSALFRYGWLAHTLGISVLEFLRLRQFTGLDPFASLDPATSPPVEPPIIRFIRLYQAMTAAGMQSVQALYLMWNQDVSGKSAPPPATITGLAFALRADFAAVEAQFVLEDDPDGSIAQSLMTLVYGSTATDYFFGLLNNTMPTSVPYTYAGPTLPQPVVDASGGRLSYDNLGKQLGFAGVLDATTLGALQAAIAINTTDKTDNVAAGGVSLTPVVMTNIYPSSVLTIDTGAAQETVVVAATTATGFTTTTTKPHNGTATPFAIVSEPSLAAALAVLAAAGQQAVGPFFATYPELQPLYAAYVASSDPVQTKRQTLLANFLPTLKQERKEEQALASITAAAGSDTSFASALLQDPTVLHADTDPTTAAVTDLTAIENTGLSAAFYLGNNPTAPADQTADSVDPLSYVPTATIGGRTTPGDVLTTTINGLAIPYKIGAADTSLALLAGNIAAAINATTTLDPISHLPINKLVSASSTGSVVAIGAASPWNANGLFSLACSSSAGATETYTAGSQLPAGTGGGPIAGVWTGYINVPQDGFYNFAISADPGAKVLLQIDGENVIGAAIGGVWQNQSPVSLVAGALVPLVLTVTSIKTTLSVSWQSLGLGWQLIPGQYLYSQSLVSRLSNTYVRFLKATSLASTLSLTADEIGYLGTSPGVTVDTTDATAIAAGNAVFKPASMSNIAVGSVLVVDRGSAQEAVTVTAVTATTFSAVAAHPHDGTATPFVIVNQAAPQIGHGWLNFLTPAGDPGLTTAAKLCDVLTALLDFARIKQALSPNDERLLAVLQDPSAYLPGGSQSALLSLTGWAQVSLNALLTRFFGNTQVSNLSDIERFRRTYDAYSIVQTCRVTASAIIAAVTNAPTATMVGALQSALRALYAESDWLTVVRPINDTMRISQRDALVAYILQQLGDAYAQSLVNQTTNAAAVTGATQLTFASTAGIATGMLVQGLNIAPGTAVNAIASISNTVTLNTGILGALPAAGTVLTFVPASAVEIATADELFEYFLIDAETQPPVETSRIRLALSSVQLFIERIIRNLEPQVSPSDIDATQWTWMKRYRVWQANREVFLWPENWLYPELRDDQSPIFQQMMSSLLQGDITDDAAAAAYLDYLTNLEEVAKLEPCGLYYQPGTSDTNEASYVVARTAGAHRKYYFRELQNGSWTPWAEVKIDCEDMPLTPIVWNSRLFLFWLRVLKPTAPQPIAANTHLATSGVTSGSNINDVSLDDIQSFGKSGVQVQKQNGTTVQAVLCWSEYYNGKWQPTKTSEINRPVTIGNFTASGPGSFDVDRNLVQIVPVQCTGLSYSMLFDPYVNLPDIPINTLILAISTPGNPFPTDGTLPGFVLYNTHSLPVRLEDIPVQSGIPDDNLGRYIDVPCPYRALSPIQSYTGGNDSDTFWIDYFDTIYNYVVDNPIYSSAPLTFNWMPRFVDTQPGLADAWFAPFFYEDRRNLFYVTTSENVVTIDDSDSFGVAFGGSRQAHLAQRIAPIEFKQGAPIRVALGSGWPISYQGQLLASTGSRNIPGSTDELSKRSTRS